MTSRNLQRASLLLLVAAVAAFYLMTVRTGHTWGDDFAMYILHAKNLAEGYPYADTGYIYNSARPALGPETYPPVFPLLLTPIYKVFGLNLTMMKVEGIVFFLIFLCIYYVLLRSYLSFPSSLLAVALIGFNPFFWSFKDRIQSDLLFLVWAYASLLVVNRLNRPVRLPRHEIFYTVALAILLYLSYGTRSIGVVLLPTILIYDLTKFKRPRRSTSVAGIISIGLVSIQSMLIHSDASYLDQLSVESLTIAQNIYAYTKSLGDVWDNGHSYALQGVVFAVTTAFSVLGYVRRVRYNLTVVEVFLPLYALCVIVWPGHHGTRLLLPVVPLYILYMLVGFTQLQMENSRHYAAAVVVGICILCGVSYVAQYSKVDLHAVRVGVGEQAARELFAYIREHTHKRDVIVFAKPRALTLFTGRRAAAYGKGVCDECQWEFLCGIGAEYLIAGNLDAQEVHSFVRRYRPILERVYWNAKFVVYRIEDRDPVCTRATKARVPFSAARCFSVLSALNS